MDGARRQRDMHDLQRTIDASKLVAATKLKLPVHDTNTRTSTSPTSRPKDSGQIHGHSGGRADLKLSMCFWHRDGPTDWRRNALAICICTLVAAPRKKKRVRASNLLDCWMHCTSTGRKQIGLVPDMDTLI